MTIKRAERRDAEALGGDEQETPSGLHEIRVRELNWQGAKLTIAMVVVAVGTAFGAYRVVLGEALAQTDAGMAPIKQRVDTLEQQQKELRSDVHEVQTDIRALYKAVMTGRPQERLERPPPSKDGGP